MAMTEIKWCELHSPIFLGGTNLQQKLDPTKRSGLKMFYDEDKKQLYVTFNGHTARIPEPSILSMVEGTPGAKQAQPSHPQRKIAASAQVSTPHGHVFQGPGSGDTGLGGTGIAKGRMKF